MVGDKYGLTGVPETYFVNRKGRLVGVPHRRDRSPSPKFARQFEDGVRAALNS